jgi:hypothetical protein
MQNDVAAEPMNAAREKARTAKEKVLSFENLFLFIKP